MSNYTTKRKDYGIYVDTISNKFYGELGDRVTEVREQVKSRNYQNLETVAKQEFEAAEQYVRQYGLKQGMKYPSISGKRYHILCTAKGAIFLTYQYQHVSSDVMACIKAGTPVTVFSPFKDEDMVKVTSLGQWYELLNAERESNKAYGVSTEYSKWEAETYIELKYILNTPTPWLGTNFLVGVVSKFPTLADFLFYAQAKIAELEEQGEYDIELTKSYVMTEKSSVWHSKKDGYAHTNDKPDYWEGYEVFPVDICRKFIHLTYLESIDYKPLKRMYSVDSTLYTGKEIWLGQGMEDMVRTTPIYIDQNEIKENGKVVSHQFDEYQEDFKALKAMGYEEAKAYLNKKYN